MPPKPKGKALAPGKAAVSKSKSPAPRGSASAAVQIPEPQPPPSEPVSLAEAEAALTGLDPEAWKALWSLEEPPVKVGQALKCLLLLLGEGEAEAGKWSVAQGYLKDPTLLLAMIHALGPWGSSVAQLQAAEAALHDLARGSSPPAAPLPPSSPAGVPKARARTPAKIVAPKPKAAPPKPPMPGGPAGEGLRALAEALLLQGKAEAPPKFPMLWPTVPFAQLHTRLQQALASRQAACIVCPSATAARACAAFLQRAAAVVCDLAQLQLEVQLAKSKRLQAAVAELGSCVREALGQGRRLALLLGEAPPNMRHFCNSTQAPIELFDFESLGAAAAALGLSEAAIGFHLISVVQCSKARAETLLPQLLPGFDEMAVLVIDFASLPPPSALHGDGDCSLSTALRLLALPASAEVEETTESGDPVVNSRDFEYLEAFGEDWEQRWGRGPAKKDENGKPIKETLINLQLVKYPADPKEAKPCIQLMGGAANAPCTGIWTSFSPLIRPTEIEFEFTINGKVDMPNACVVFTERAFEGALPDCKVGVQFTVRGGMQLSGGGGNLVRISNDGKIKNDKWNKVLMKIDWGEKAVVAQVDTRGKGYAPAIQTVPFRDKTCVGFGFLYIYNTDVQATCWFHSLRIRQDAHAVEIDSEALDARAHLAARLQEREYQRAVDADMEVGMKMGAIKATKDHGMNLAQEQAANSSGM